MTTGRKSRSTSLSSSSSSSLHSLPLWQVEYTWVCPKKGSAFVRLDSGTFPPPDRERERKKERVGEGETKRRRVVTRPPFHPRDPFPSVIPGCIDHRPCQESMQEEPLSTLSLFASPIHGPFPPLLSATEWSERASGLSRLGIFRNISYHAIVSISGSSPG